MNKIYARKLLGHNPDTLWHKVYGREIEVIFDDGSLVMTATEIILSVYCWAYHVSYPTLPLLKEHTIKSYYKNGKPRRAMHVSLMEDLYSLLLDAKQIMHPDLTYKFIEVACVTNNNIYNTAFYETARYIKSTSVMDDIELVLHPDLVKLKNDLIDVEINEQLVSDALDDASDLVTSDLLNDKGVVNRWSWLSTRDLVKTKQLLQNIFLRGYITDTDDFVIDFPILDSYITGMRTYRSYNIVARENAVAVESQQDQLRRASSDSRRMTYAASYKRGIEYMDCGSKDYRTYSVQDQAHLNILSGTYMLNEKLNTLQRVAASHTHLIGKTVLIRSQFTCKLEDPSVACCVCVGALSESIPYGVNFGADISRAIHQVIIQIKMSMKHYLKSSGGNTVLMSQEFMSAMRENANRDIFLRDVVWRRAKKLVFRIPATNTNLLTVFDVSNVHMMTLSQVSTVNHLEIDVEYKTKKDSIEFATDKGGVKAMFSYRALEFIHSEYKNGHERITIVGQSIEIDLTGFDFSKAVFKRPNIAVNNDQPNKHLIDLYERVGTDMQNKRMDEENILETLGDIVNISAELDMKVSLGAIEAILSAYICEEGSYSLSRGFKNTTHGSALRVLANRSLSMISMLRDQKKIVTAVRVYLNTERDDGVLDVVMDPVGMLKKHNIPATALQDRLEERQ